VKRFLPNIHLDPKTESKFVDKKCVADT